MKSKSKSKRQEQKQQATAKVNDVRRKGTKNTKFHGN
jgi:hypothetical protein